MSYIGKKPVDFNDVTEAQTFEVTGDLSLADKIVHTGDTNTAIRFPAADTVTIETGGSERLRVDSSVLINSTAARSAGGYNPPALQIESTNFSSLNVIENQNGTSGAGLMLAKSRGTTVGSNTIVQDGDTLGTIRFTGADGTDLRPIGAEISAVVSGTPGNNDMPASLVFGTTADGAQNSTERMRILSGGGLTFNGDTAAANALDDYEEGSWTPTYTSTGGDLVVAGYVFQFGRYVKIGKMCQVNGGIQTSGITTTGTGDVRVSGLPFNIANLSGGFIAGAVGYSQNFLSVNPQSVLGFPNTDTISFRYNVTTDSRSAITGSINTSNLSGTNNHNLCWFSITYTVTA